MKIAAYCRVSTEKDEQLDSLENQKEFFEKKEKKKGGGREEKGKNPPAGGLFTGGRKANI